MARIGFTGTRNGMTEEQSAAARDLILSLQPTEAHLGDCVGADTEFYTLLKEHAPGCRLHGHIPDQDSARAHLQYSIVHPPKPYLVRNRDIVDSSDILIAAPAGRQEQLRSGTWATVRYARKMGKQIMFLYPS